jgi:hypothetical protein
MKGLVLSVEIDSLTRGVVNNDGSSGIHVVDKVKGHLDA